MSFLYFFYELPNYKKINKNFITHGFTWRDVPVSVLPIVELPEMQFDFSVLDMPVISPSDRELFPDAHTKRVSSRRRRTRRVSYGFFHQKNRIKRRFLFRSKKLTVRKKRSNFLYTEFPTVRPALVITNVALNTLLYATNQNKHKFFWGEATHVNSIWLWNLYTSNVAYLYTGLYTEWSFVSLHTLLRRDEFTKWWKAFYRKNVLKQYYTKKTKFFNWFVQLCYLKDPQNLIEIAEQVLIEATLKQHKQLFSTFSDILEVWYSILSLKRKAKGCTVFFKGKLGKKGSVKKTKFFYKIGSVSFTQKSLRLNYRTFIIPTHTGVIGAGIHVFY